MAGFKFRFQSLLNIKEQIEEREKLALGKLVQKQQEEQNKLDAILGEEQRAINAFYEKNGQSVRAKELSRLNQTIQFFNRMKQEQMLVIKKCKEEVIRQREVLRLAVIDRKSYEKLKEKALEKYREEELDIEKKTVDEIVSFKYHDN